LRFFFDLGVLFSAFCGVSACLGDFSSEDVFKGLSSVTICLESIFFFLDSGVSDFFSAGFSGLVLSSVSFFCLRFFFADLGVLFCAVFASWTF